MKRMIEKIVFWGLVRPGSLARADQPLPRPGVNAKTDGGAAALGVLEDRRSPPSSTAIFLHELVATEVCIQMVWPWVLLLCGRKI